ncbi:MAG: BamA/TamA family outer membrane protein [Steroidobacteraceae bacterium]
MNLRSAPRRAVVRAAVAVALCVSACSLARAEIKIEISGIDGDLRRNVQALLSVERYKDRDRLEEDAVQRLFGRVDTETRNALRPFGYYEPRVDAHLKQEGSKDWRVDIKVEPGQAVHVNTVSVVVEGEGQSDPSFQTLAEHPTIQPGQQLDHGAYETLKGSLQRVAASNGYMDARMLRNELRVNLATHEADIDLAIETGRRYHFGATTIQQSAVREKNIRRYLRYNDGEPYDAVKLLRTQFALDDSTYFSNVEVTAGDPDRETLAIPIRIQATTGRNTYSIGAGYGTDTDVRGTLTFTDPLVNSLGHRLRVQLQASDITQEIIARYDIPFGDPAREKLSAYLVRENSVQSDSVSTSVLSLTPSITQVLGRWQRVLSFAMAHNVTRDAVNGRQVENLAVPGITYASVPEGYLGEDLFSRTFYVQLLASHPELGASAPFLRLDLQFERVFDLSPKWHLLLRNELGATAVNSVDNLSGTYRFFAGGDRSVRGFGYDTLSPTEISSTGSVERIGGRDLFTGTVEFERDLPRLWGVAAFTDYGNAFNYFGDPLALSVGVGVRWRLPVVTFGLDIAQALRAPGYDELPGPRFHLNISPKL